MEWLSTVSLVLSSLLILLPQGFCDETAVKAPETNTTGIWCYVCNSKDDPRCGHPFDYRHMKPVNCVELEYLDDFQQELMKSEGKPAPNLCRKNIQTVTLSGKTDYRIVRKCGFMPKNKAKYGVEVDEEDTEGENRCYKRAGTFEVAVTYCTCTTDNCNGAFRTGTGILAPFLLAGLLVKQAYYNY